MKRRTVFVILAALVAISLASAGSADAQEMDCAMCHPDKAEGARPRGGLWPSLLLCVSRVTTRVSSRGQIRYTCRFRRACAPGATTRM
jgi:hypothetical protein